jgi:hypothetical protein
LDDAIDSDRSNSRASGTMSGWAPALRLAMAASASETIPAVSPAIERSRSVSGSGMNAWYAHARRYIGGA